MISTSRRNFLASLASGGAGLTLAACGESAATPEEESVPPPSPARPKGSSSVANLVVPKMETVRFGVIGVGRRGSTLVRLLSGVDGAEVVAIADIDEAAAGRAQNTVFKAHGTRPVIYTSGDDDWRNLVAREDIDAVLVVTPWSLHAPMALTSMAAGKQTFVEVPAALTIDESWQLVEASEKFQVNCMMMENVCYGRAEMMALSMVRAGVLGELLHGEAAYIHELRFQMKDVDRGTGSWRTPWHAKRNANLYPTHGLGPIAQYMTINRGDSFDYLNSVSSPALGRRAHADGKLPDSNRFKSLEFVCGDMNTSLIKTKLGRTIVLQHDTTTPRPYSRHNLIQGVNGVFAGFPDRIALQDNPLKPKAKYGYHKWDDDMAKWQAKYDHPIWTKLTSQGSLEGRQGSKSHGGMDYVMLWRMVYCLRNGIRLDQNVYDAAAWSVIVELSETSVKERGAPIDFPDFTRGEWASLEPLEITI